MNDSLFRTLFLGGMNLFMFGGLYLFGRKNRPKRALWLCSTSFVVLTTLCFFSTGWIMASLLLSLVFLFLLKKPDQSLAFKQLYTNNNIYTSQQTSPAIFEVLGDKKWSYAEGSFLLHGGKKIQYLFWQGSTSSMVSTGQYTRSTVYTHYLAFIFQPGTVTENFKRKVQDAADKSGFTFWQKLRYQFAPNTEVPNLVATAKDGSFIVQYVTLPDVEHYSRRLEWMKNAARNN